MGKKITLLLLGILCCFSTLAQSRGRSFTISGTITDKESGETLIGATIYDARTNKGTATNSFGRYSLTLPKDTVELVISFVGYSSYHETFMLNGNRELNYAMKPSVELETVNIVGEKVNSVKSSQISAIDIPVKQIKSIPVIFGETDVLKVIQLMPGVQSGSEGMSGMYVRGGGPDENLFLLDGIPLYNVNHLGGFFSAFNSDAVKNITLYKGSFPAHFGGRLSSVLDITTNNGNDKKIHGSASIGLISAKANIEGPIIKEKTTFSLSYRRTYSDLFTRLALAMASTKTSDSEVHKVTGGYHFYDLNGKITHKFSDRSHLFASLYMGDDRLTARVRFKEEYDANYYEREYMKLGYNWGNIVASLRWNYELGPKLFMNLTGAYTRYRNNIKTGVEFEGKNEYMTYNEEMSMTYKSGIRDIISSADFDYAPSPNHAIRFGASVTEHVFTPEVMSLYVFDSNYTEGNIDSVIGESKVYATELNAYIEDDWSVSNVIKLNAGVRLSGFAVQNTFYPSIQPRLSGRIIITDDLSFKIGYAYMTQYMHLLSNSNISLPTDLWVPVTENIKPMTSQQVAAGFFYKLKNMFDFSIEGYYKTMNNLLEYKDGASFWSSSTKWENKVAMGRGWAYGVEFLVQKNIGKWTGWIGYTWSKSMRLFDREDMTISNGKPFPAKYDRRHDISIIVMYKPSDKFDISTTWVYNTGNAVTLAIQNYDDYNDVYPYYNDIPYIESRNNYRMPAYHRMDLSVNFHKQSRHGVHTWNISVYNVYNHKNPYLIYVGYGEPYIDDEGNTYNNSLMKLSLFPIIPSFSYSFKF